MLEVDVADAGRVAGAVRHVLELDRLAAAAPVCVPGGLAAAQAEKSGLEETVRRCELQIRTLTDDKAALMARADAAEERAKELTRQRDAAHNERSKLTEQLGELLEVRVPPPHAEGDGAGADDDEVPGVQTSGGLEGRERDH